MKRSFLLRLLLAALCALSPFTLARAQTGAATTSDEEFRVFNSEGKPSSMEEIVGAMGGADAVLVGEAHDDAVGHRVEAELLRLAYARYVATVEARHAPRSVALSLEMFERDAQTVLDEYLAGLISERHFLLSSRPWRNYETDYRPLVEFARAHKLPVIAANAPARYVSRVAQNGPASLDALSKEAKAWLPPLPVAPASRDYAAKFTRFMSGGDTASPAPAGQQSSQQQPSRQTQAQQQQAQQSSAHASAFLLDAQNLRDASMGDALAEHLRRNSGALVLHFNGRFHSEGRLGVAEHLLRLRPKARLLVVTIFPSTAFPDFEASGARGLGDFVILTNPARARTR
ncbi:MAG TPA: ChaN family lipoprotein [Pyrinomonadaceae bacterium]|nr:ChaN family lipoprotein [Pyrinomonadaceae bacterium]